MHDPTIHHDYQRIQEAARQPEWLDEPDEYSAAREERFSKFSREHHEGWSWRIWRFLVGAMFWIAVIALFQGG